MPEAKRKIRWSSAWADARELVWAHRRRLMLGAVLMTWQELWPAKALRRAGEKRKADALLAELKQQAKAAQ